MRTDATLSLPPSADFADWLPPMLVKELRQGLRTNVFVGVFVLIQAAMLIFTGLRLAGGDSFWAGDGFLWLSMAGTLLFIMPARGLAAISDEEKAKTLDLVQLTHLGGFQIVLQKWLALASQSLLLVIAVLPYVALRYFFGGVDVVHELLCVGWMFCLSLPLTALSIALSTAPRAVRTLVFLPPSAMLVIFAVAGLSNPYAPIFNHASDVYASLFASVTGSAFALAVAAARISAVAENATARIRLIALFTVLLSVLGRWLTDEKEAGWAALTLPILIWAAIEAMAEQTCEIPSLYTPWVRRGALGRLAGRLLYPGWAPGMAFSALLAFAFAPHLYLNRLFASRPWLASAPDWEYMAGLVALLIMAMVFPAVLLCYLPRMRHRHWACVGVQAVCFAVWVIGESFSDKDIQAVLCSFTPLSTFLWGQEGSLDYRPLNWLAIASVVNGIPLLILLYRSMAEFRKIRSMERQAASLSHAG